MDNIHKYPWHNPENRDGDPRPLMTCGYCGSMHPGDLAEAIKAGARLDWADFKYGWPHKVYVEGIPNIFAGEGKVICSTTRSVDSPMSKEEIARHQFSETPVLEEQIVQTLKDGVMTKETRSAQFRYERREPMPATTHGKFYTEHLQDATEEERAIIEEAMGLTFGFQNGKVTWSKT